MVMLIICFNANAQLNKPADITRLEVKVENRNLLINWASSNSGIDNYWQVQGSRDGKQFSTIGLVFGEDPSTSTGNYKYKQQLGKIKPGLKYYRVLYVKDEDFTSVSETIKLTK